MEGIHADFEMILIMSRFEEVVILGILCGYFEQGSTSLFLNVLWRRIGPDVMYVRYLVCQVVNQYHFRGDEC